MKNISIKAAQVAHACYILSAIMVLYTLLSIFNIHQYIQSLVDANQLIVSQQLFKVFITYLDSSLPSLCYALILLALGFILQKRYENCRDILVNQPPVEKKEKQEVENEDDIDAYLKSI
jgi:hypothetical protein